MRQPSALVAIVDCFPLWLKICHRHIFLTSRALVRGSQVRSNLYATACTSVYEILSLRSRMTPVLKLTLICPQPRSEAPNATNETFLVILERSEESRKVSEYSGTSDSEVIESRHHRQYTRQLTSPRRLTAVTLPCKKICKAGIDKAYIMWYNNAKP